MSGSSSSGLAKGSGFSKSDIHTVRSLRVRREDWGETASRLTHYFALRSLKGVSSNGLYKDPSVITIAQPRILLSDEFLRLVSDRGAFSFTKGGKNPEESRI
jgi:hypothetical protein